MKTLLIVACAAAALAQAPGSSKYPEMTPIPAGEFAMGDHHNFVDPAHPSDEVPIHNVWLDAFFAGTYDVTNRQYVEYLNAAYAQGLIEVRGGMVYGKGTNVAYCETRQMSDYSSIAWDGAVFTVADFRATHPVVGIRWNGAAAYTNWLSEALGLQPCYDVATWRCDFSRNGFRLPTEAEWEYAARGGQTNPYRKFPWGDDADYAKANWPDSKDPYETGPYPWTTPSGFYSGQLQRRADFAWPGAQDTYQTANGANGFGLHDMTGNVWQWCHDWYGRDYYSVSPYRNPTGPAAGDPMPDGLPYRVMRGGNWYNGDATDPGHGRVSNRDPGYFRGPQDPNHPYYHVGFRVVRPAPPLSTRSAASFAETVAPGSIATSFGSGLDGAAVTVRDWAGVEREAAVLGSAAGQVNFVVPPQTAVGQATVTVSVSGVAMAAGSAAVEAVAPGLFSANGDGKGAAAGVAVRITPEGQQFTTLLYDESAPAGSRSAVPIDLGSPEDSTYVLLFGTGMGGGNGNPTATIGGIDVAVAIQSLDAGLEQIKLGPLPASLAGEVAVTVTVNGRPSNVLSIGIVNKL